VTDARPRARLRFALDTNILIYAERLGFAPSDAAKEVTARRLLGAATDDEIVLPRQVLAEFQRVLVRKAGLAAGPACDRVALWAARGELVDTNGAVFDAALELASDHGLQIFDAIILAAAVEARCDLLLSEDLQDGFAWRGVTVTNPFGAAPDTRLARLLTG
jgi:predicted nucleic acid-binding protein